MEEDGVSAPAERKSLIDLQSQLAEIFDSLPTSSVQQGPGGTRICACRELPTLVTTFQNSRRTVILDDAELQSFRQFAKENPDVHVNSEDLFQLLAQMLGRGAEAQGMASPKKRRVRTAESPESSDVEGDLIAHQLVFGGSGSSGDETGSGDEGSVIAGAQYPSSPSPTGSEPSGDDNSSSGAYLTPRTSVRPSRRRSSLSSATFNTPETPSSSVQWTAISAPGGGFMTPSEQLRRDLAHRQRSSPLDASGRRKPGPPGRPRKSDTGPGKASRQNSEEPASPGSSALGTSPGGPGGVKDANWPASPSSPSSNASDSTTSPGGEGIDSTSFHDRPLSPTAEETEGVSPFDAPPSIASLFPPHLAVSQNSDDVPAALRREASTSSESREPGGDLGAENSGSSRFSTFGSLDNQGNFRPDSVGSMHQLLINSGLVSGPSASGGSRQSIVMDSVRQLEELTRRNKELEDRLGAAGIEADEQREELEAKLEELKAEVARRKKDEKDWKAKERAMGGQVSALEAEVAQVQKTVERGRENYAILRRQYEEQLSEAEKLRNALRDKDRELKEAEKWIAAHSDDNARWDNERKRLDEVNASLEASLAIARQAEDLLEEQKHENLSLRETIDRLRFDLDDLRNQARNAAAPGSSGRPGSSTNSIAGSMSKSLGNELARQLAGNALGEAETDSGEETEEERTTLGRARRGSMDSFTEEVLVTTRRRRRRAGDTGDAANASEPRIVHLVEDTREVAEASVQAVPACHSADVQTEPVEPPPVYRPPAEDVAIQTDKEQAIARAIEAKAERSGFRWERVFDAAGRPVINIWPRHSSGQGPASATMGVAMGAVTLFALGMGAATMLQAVSGGPAVTQNVFIGSDVSHWKLANSMVAGGMEGFSSGDPGTWPSLAWWWSERFIWHGVSVARRMPS